MKTPSRILKKHILLRALPSVQRPNEDPTTLTVVCMKRAKQSTVHGIRLVTWSVSHSLDLTECGRVYPSVSRQPTVNSLETSCYISLKRE